MHAVHKIALLLEDLFERVRKRYFIFHNEYLHSQFLSQDAGQARSLSIIA